MEERKLTKKEQERKEVYEKVCEKMKKDGYKKHDLTVGLVFANIAAFFLAIPFIAVMGIIYFTVNTGAFDSVSFWDFYLQLLISFLLLIALVVIHELIHGLTWGIFAKNHFKSISFGIIWKAVTPYCTCSEPLKKWQYIIGTLMPTVILSLGLGIISIFSGSLVLFFAAMFMFLGGGGDMLVVIKLLMYRTKNKDAVIYDHPYECGLVVFEKDKN